MIQQKSRNRVLNTPIEINYKKVFSSFNLNPQDSSVSLSDAFATIRYYYYADNLNSSQRKVFLDLFHSIKKTITEMPMKFIGESYYEIFKPQTDYKKPKSFSRYSYQDFGSFVIDEKIYTAFKFLGFNFLGYITINERWIELTKKLNPTLSFDKILSLLDIQSSNRTTSFIRNCLDQNWESPVLCIWSGKELITYDIDHILPYSLFMNNDIWNLLPSDPKINNKKKDKIPSPKLIENSQERIITYWKFYKNHFNEFNYQRNLALGKYSNEKQYIEQLKQKCNFFIKDLGFPSFIV